MKHAAFVLLLITTLPWSSVHGATIAWTNQNGGVWSAASNWSPNQVPGPADTAIITNVGNYPVNITNNTTVGALSLGGASGTQSLVITTATMTITGVVTVNPRGEVNLQGSTLTAGSPMTLNGVMNWTAGTFTGPVTVTTNGLLRISGVNGKALVNGSLTNAGTVIYGGSGNLGWTGSTINNLAGALFDMQGDGTVFHSSGPPAVFHNGGVLRKSAGTGTSQFSTVALNNSGIVEVQTGTIQFGGGGTFGGQFNIIAGAALNLSGGGTITGTFNAALGATVTFSGGSFGVIPTSSLAGQGAYRMTGGQVTLVERIPNLQLQGGTVSLAAGFQGGTITNLAITGAILAGTNRVTGTLIFSNGQIHGPLTVAEGGLLEWIAGTVSTNLTVLSNGLVRLSGFNGKSFLNGVLTNSGTVIYGGSGNLGISSGTIYNLAGGLFDIQGDATMFHSSGFQPVFHNAGLLRKSAGTGTTTFSGVALNNSGIVEGLSGTIQFGDGGTFGGQLSVAAGATLNLSGGGTITGTFNAALGGTVTFSGGSFGVIPTSSLTGPGLYRLTSNGQLTLVERIPNLQLQGGTVSLAAGFQGGTITNLTIAGATLVGTNLLTGTLIFSNGTINGPLTVAGGGLLEWLGGTIASNLTVLSNGLVRLSGSTGKSLNNGALTNSGTVIYGGSGNLGMSSSAIYNLAGGLFDLQSDGLMFYSSGTQPVFHNAGLLRKSAGEGTSTFSTVPLNNSGTVELLTGTLTISGFSTLGGQINVATGATLTLSAGATVTGTFNTALGGIVNFSGGSFGVIPTTSLTGPGSHRLTGGTLTLVERIPNLQLQGGTVTLVPGFQGGTITNLSINGATLVGTNRVTGTLIFSNGTINGPLTVAAGGLLEWMGGTIASNVTVLSNGLVRLSGTSGKGLVNGSMTNAGVVLFGGNAGMGMSSSTIYNLAGALFDLQTNASLFYSSGTQPGFQNAGLLRKSASSATFSFSSVTLSNTGTIEIQTGTISVNESYTQTGGELRMALRGLTDYGRLALSGTSQITGTLTVYLTGGYLPVVSNKFSVVTYSGFSGTFTQQNLPEGFNWLSQYEPAAFTITVLGACTPPPTNLAAWWPADGNANDLAGGNNGSLQNGASFAPGLIGQAFNLDGVNDFVETPDSPAFDFGANDFSVALWANFRTVRASSLGNPAAVFVGHDEGTGGQDKWFFALGGGLLNFHLNGAGIGARFLAQASFAPLSNIWYHLAVTRSNGVYRIFTNGVQAASQTDATPIPDIAASITFGQAEGIGFMDGLLDEIIIVNRSLAPAELNSIRNAGSLGLCRPTQPPIILAQPQSRTNAVGTLATFSVTAAGSAPLLYRWHFNGSPLTNGGRISGALSNVLNIASAQPGDVGAYSVTVSNAAGATSSFPAQLVLDGSAPIISQLASNPGVNQCIITWLTDEAATATVEYGPTAAYDSTNRFNGSLRLQHTITLTGLIPGSTYHFRVRSADGVGNETISADGTFTLLPAPDLRVVNLNVTSAGPIQSGADITIRWEDTNSGAGLATDSWYDRVQVMNTTNGASVLDTYVLHGTAGLGILTNGGTHLRQHVFRLPDGLAGAGPLRVTVTADYFNSVVEYNPSGSGETNNATSANFSSALAPYPDLAIASFTASPATFESSRQVTVDWVLTNLGTAPVTGDFYDRVRVRNLSLSNNISDQLYYLNPPADPLGPIGIGQSRQRTASFKLPDGPAGVGNIEITLFLDSGNRIFEYRSGTDAEANNTNVIVRTSTLAPYPDLVVSNVIAPATGMPGQPIDVTWTVSNNGAVATPTQWVDQVFLIDDTNSIAAQLLSSFTFDGVLAVGASSNVTRSVTLPFFTVGTRRLAVRANSGAAFFETDFTNNYRTSVTTIALSPRLELTLNRTSVRENGGSNTVTAKVLRNSSTTSNLTVTLTSSDTNSVPLPLAVIIPAGQSYHTFAVPIADNGLVDSNRTVTLGASAPGFGNSSTNLVVEDDDLPSLALQLTPTQINEDSGPAAAMGFLTRNTPTNNALAVTVISDSTAHLLPPATVTIPAGQYATSFLITAATNTTIDGENNIRIQASAPGFQTASATLLVLDNDVPTLGIVLAANAIAEGAESPATTGRITRNPPFTGALNVVLQQSLRGLLILPAEVTIPAGQGEVPFNISVTDDQLVNGSRTNQLIARVRGTGGPLVTNGQAAATLIVYDNDGPTLTLALANDVVRENGSVAGTVTRNTGTAGSLIVNLASSVPSEAVPATATVTINNGQSAANFTINGVPDGTNDGIKPVIISASAAGFNSATAPLNVSDIDLPDLAVGDIIVPSSGQINARANVTFTVANSGPVPANGSWVDRIYISTDNQLGGDTVAGAVTNSMSLAAGSSYTRTVSVKLPPDPGNYHIIVVTEADNQLVEGSERNNVISIATIDVQPNYRATAETTLVAAPCNTPVPITGRAFNPDDNSPARFELVTVRVRTGAARRLYNLFTDANGNFQMTFTPLPTEVGDYQLSADHPRVLTDTAQDTFSLLGFGSSVSAATITIVPQTLTTGQITLQNMTGVPLTGIAALATNAPASLGLVLNVPSSLAGHASGTLEWSLNTTITNAARVVFPVVVTSAEGCSHQILFTVNIAPLQPQLVADPAFIDRGMVRGQQTLVPVTIRNVGGVDTGPIEISLPLVSWMKLAGSNQLASLDPGQSTTMNVLLEPPADLPLLLYNGSIGIGNGRVALNLPYRLRAMSTALGDLLITATDDYTYYVAGNPKLTNAAVTISDPFTGQIVTNGVTGTNGEVRFVGLLEGTYTVQVTAPQHNTFRGTANIQPGAETSLEAFLMRQTVSYRWSVVPVEVEDRYRVVLESVFEAEVPIPNLIIEEPFIMPLVFEGETNQFELALRNEGLIAAENVEIKVPNHPVYVLEPLVSKLGTVPAKSRLVVPVLIYKKPNVIDPLKFASLKAGTKEFDPNCEMDTAPCLPKIKMGVIYSYKCGPNGVEKTVAADLSPICLAKAIKDCIKDALSAAGSGAGLASGGNVFNAACDMAKAILSCAGVELSGCQSAALSIGCGLLTGGLAGAGSGALGPDSLKCICELIGDVSISLPSAPPNYGQVNYVDGGLIGSNPSGFNGIPWSVGYVIGPGNCSSSDAQKTTTSRPKAQGVCARVRIQISQEAVLTRVAFKGSLEIDNDSDTAISGIRVALDVRDADGNPAGDRFVVRPPTVTGMGNVDGTGSVGAFGSGVAEYLFIPTRDAAPTAPAAYRIGGSLRYIDNGQEVTVPLLSATITVYPEARLQLRYFQSRDVYSDDPFTDEIEPAEPFALGLIAKNIGAGPARNFRITSAQPKIIENEKGLLIDFKIIGSQVGTNAAEPSLTAILGNIPAGQSQVAQWLFTSTLQGKFIEYKATFEHVDNFGSTNLSLIDSVEIHELIKPVLADRPGDDLAPDFLANDIPDPDSLPDVLYQSDGSSALVESRTAGTFSNPIGAGTRQTTLTFSAPSGWVYLRLPDPGPGWELYRVVRSDNKVLKVGTNTWTTDRTFPSAITGVVRVHQFHLLDHDSTGSYTLFYRPVDEIAPTLVSVGPVTPAFQTVAVNTVDVVFSEEIDASTFGAADVSLSLNGGPNLIGIGVTFVQAATNRITISDLAPLTGLDGTYELAVNAAGVADFGGNAGVGTLSTLWVKGSFAPVVTALGPIVPNPRNTPVSSVEVAFSRAINASTFGREDVTLTRNGGSNLVTAAVQVNQIETNRFIISGLDALTEAQGEYRLTVNATGISDIDDNPGAGTRAATWRTLTSGPQVVSLEDLATNPRNIVVASLDVTFAAPINPATFTWQDLTLSRNAGPNLITSAVTVQQVSPTLYRIANFNWAVGQEGTYVFTVNAAGITDGAGNGGSGSASESWLMDTTRPLLPTALALAPDLGVSNTDELINSLTPTLSGQLPESNLTVRVKDLTTGIDLGTSDVVGQAFTKVLSLGTAGAHRLQVRSVDAAGNTSFPDAFLDVFVDIAQPSAVIAPVLPALRSTPVSTVNVTFSESINPATFTRDDLTLRRQNGANLINTGVQIVNVLSNEYQITGLTALTDVPGSYQLTLNMNTVQDRAGNPGSNTVSISWSRTGSNQPPTLAFIPNRSVSLGESIRFTNVANDPDVGQALTFSLNIDAPANARVDENTGVFQWVPTRSQAPGVYSIVVTVTDDGVPAASASRTFTVAIGDYTETALGETVLLAGEDGSLNLALVSTAGLTNLIVEVSMPTNRLSTPQLANLSSLVRTAGVQVLGQGRYRMNVTSQPGQSIRGSNVLAQFQFDSNSNQPSAFVALPLANVTARQPDGTVVATTFVRDGRVVMIRDQPLLEMARGSGGLMNLRLFSRPGDAHALERADAVTGPWTPINRLRFQGRERSIALNPGTVPIGFFRLATVDVDTPFFEIVSRDASGMDVVFYAQRGLTFDLQRSSSLNPPWSTWHTQTMTNSFHEFRVNFAPDPHQFLRARKQ
jgi:hypothetical protein